MHVSVLTKDGEACSLTSTVNLILGARIMDNSTGIILNDEMDDFSIPGVSNAFGLAPSPYNYIHPFKRPLSSSVPTIVEKDGKVIAVAGASGGSHIITSTFQTLVKMLDFGYDAYKAVHDPRGHHQLIPHNVWLEHATSKEIVDGLLERGHQVVVAGEGVSSSGVAAIKVDPNGRISGAGDARKNGMAVAY
jgi:gamma-glutamyltranspeptidase/glutathione hydrolase/leukotriene-C4 hydrolase